MTIPCITVGSGEHHVFVLHGWFGSADGWGLFPTYLDGERFSYHFTDNRGYGARMDERGHYSLDEVADDVLALADSLDAQTFSLIGHSMGGAEVRRILTDLGIEEKEQEARIIEVWNKIDMLGPGTRAALLVQDARTPGIHAVSALTGEGLPDLLAGIDLALDEGHFEEDLSLPFADGKRRAALHEAGVVVSEVETAQGYDFRVNRTARQSHRADCRDDNQRRRDRRLDLSL